MQDRPSVPLLNVPRLDRNQSLKGEQLTIDSPTFYKTEQEASGPTGCSNLFDLCQQSGRIKQRCRFAVWGFGFCVFVI